MSNTLPTSDTFAVVLAEKAYSIAKTAREAQGASDLPTWSQVPDVKKIALTNAARAAYDGADVWDVWAISCGAEPDDATAVLWRQKPQVLKLLPEIFWAFGQSLRALNGLPQAPAVDTTTDILDDDGPAQLDDPTDVNGAHVADTVDDVEETADDES